VRDREALRRALAFKAAYLLQDTKGDPMDCTPEASQRPRAVEVWAALRTLGRSGVADLVERTCRYVAMFAEGLSAAGYEILNDVVINQVLVSFGDAEMTRRIIEAIQADGSCWCGGTVWHGNTAMRISVSSWATTKDDVKCSLDAMLRIAAEELSC
jgi:glutamate/tyrosine decarboxylase-like PLP-dependent enzyme